MRPRFGGMWDAGDGIIVAIVVLAILFPEPFQTLYGIIQAWMPALIIWFGYRVVRLEREIAELRSENE